MEYKKLYYVFRKELSHNKITLLTSMKKITIRHKFSLNIYLYISTDKVYNKVKSRISLLYKQQSFYQTNYSQDLIQMQIEKSDKKQNKRVRPQQAKLKQGASKDLLRLERDIFQLKKSQENETDYVIRKLMAKKEKPQIGNIQQSPLLSRLKEMMPIFHKSNEQLQHRVVEQSQIIDVKLQECESSSSSEDENEEVPAEEFSETNETETLKNKMGKMEIQKSGHPFQSDMQQEDEESSGHYVEINFLSYPYLNEQQVAQLQAKQLPEKKEEVPQSKPAKRPLIEEINSQQN